MKDVGPCVLRPSLSSNPVPQSFNLPDAFASAMDYLCPSDAPLRLAIAVSGGADSLAATLLAWEWVQKRGGELFALTVDHGLRPTSRLEAEEVHTLLTAKGIPHKILTWEGEKPTSRLQERAREARLALLAKECQIERIQYLILGHHLDDVGETRLMRLMRGSTLMGLAGMSAKRHVAGVTLLRPLLNAPKAVLKDYLQRQNVPWCEDPSNEKEIFLRVRVRKALARGDLPSLGGTEGLGRLRAAWERVLLHLFEDLGALHPLGCANLDKVRFLTLQYVWQEALLARLVPLLGGRTYPVRREAMAVILEKIKSAKTFTGGGCLFRTKGDTLWIMREPSGVRELQDTRQEQAFTWDNRFLCRTGADNAPLQKLGHRGVLHLKRACVALPPLPREAFESLPSLWQDGSPIWVYGLLENAGVDPHVTSLMHERFNEVFVAIAERS